MKRGIFNRYVDYICSENLKKTGHQSILQQDFYCMLYATKDL